MDLKKTIKRIFMVIPLPKKTKEKLIEDHKTRIMKKEEDITLGLNNHITLNSELNNNYSDYIKNILRIPARQSNLYKEIETHSLSDHRKVTMVAYYLTQFHPADTNDMWWGKGTTEWTNVSKAVPQYVGHMQPRLPGELGYYDLRIIDNIRRQAELARNYGIDCFAFYYYWFNGKRVLEKPLNEFIQNQDIDIKYCLCWANENWSKRFNGTDDGSILVLDHNEAEYKEFIKDVSQSFDDKRYYMINNKYVLIIYCPSKIPNCENIVKYWRSYINTKLGREIYLIASLERGNTIDWTKYGFDAMSQFQPASIGDSIPDVTSNYKIMRSDFKGHIYCYSDILNSLEKTHPQLKKTYAAVMPSWDNTPRRNQRGIIYDGNTPELFKKWLNSIIEWTEENESLDEKIVFLNAWNEWGEGAYMEPDRDFGYGNLQSVWEANCGKNYI